MADKRKKSSKGKKPKKVKKVPRKKRLESDKDVIDDFMAGMSEDKTVGQKVITLAEYKAPKEFISSQCATLDIAIGQPGFPLSRISILHGKEGGGKTTVALQAIAEVQQQGGIGVLIDKEHKLDKAYAVKLGVDLSRLVYPPKLPTLEDVIHVIKGAIRRAGELRKKARRRIPILIVVDSLNACKAWETVEETTGKKRYPAEARIWSEELPAIVEDMSDEAVGLVFVSQVRKKMNVVYGSDEELAGGNAPKFYASLIVYIARIGMEKDSSGEKTGSKIEAECKKNQIAPPFRKAKFTIFYARGIDYEHSLVLACEDFGWIKKRKGGYLKIRKIELGQGYVQAAEFLRAHPKLKAKLMEMVRKKMKWDVAA